MVAEFVQKNHPPAPPSLPTSPELTSLSPASSPTTLRWQPMDNLSEAQIEGTYHLFLLISFLIMYYCVAQNKNEPLKTALAIGGNEVESGKFLVDMVIATRSDEGNIYHLIILITNHILKQW